MPACGNSVCYSKLTGKTGLDDNLKPMPHSHQSLNMFKSCFAKYSTDLTFSYNLSTSKAYAYVFC